MIRATTSAVTSWARAVWARGWARSRREWLLWIAARLILISIPVALWDPALIALVLDTEMIGLILTFGVTITAAQLSATWYRLRAVVRRAVPRVLHD